MSALPQTPSQTVGPFFGHCLIDESMAILARPGARGRRIHLAGRVLDGDGEPVTDAVVEIWQADAAGNRAHPADPRRREADPHFTGFGRSDTTRPGGCFRFETVKPGCVPGPDGALQAPHIAVHLFARGLLTHLSTRIYFADEEQANAQDVIFAALDPVRRVTLLAQPAAGLVSAYRVDFRLQGAGETLFFQL